MVFNFKIKYKNRTKEAKVICKKTNDIKELLFSSLNENIYLVTSAHTLCLGLVGIKIELEHKDGENISCNAIM